MERDSVNFIDWWSRASHIWTKSYNSVALTRQTWRQRKLIWVQKRFLSRKVHWFVCHDGQRLPSAVVDIDFLNRGSRLVGLLLFSLSFPQMFPSIVVIFLAKWECYYLYFPYWTMLRLYGPSQMQKLHTPILWRDFSDKQHFVALWTWSDNLLCCFLTTTIAFCMLQDM